eukprot:scaffold62925_cov75-Phaeocystis_antarctica.AAC.2
MAGGGDMPWRAVCQSGSLDFDEQLQEKNENVVRCTATCGVNTTNNVAPLLCLYGTVVTGGGAVVTGACPPSSLVTSARHSQVASRGSQPVPPPKSTRTPWLVCERE